jgi:hypothetical protein
MAKRLVLSEDEKSEAAAALLRTVAAAEEPSTAAALSRAYERQPRCPESLFRDLLEQEAEAGRIFRFVPYLGKAPRYWHADHATYARQTILRTLATKRSAAELEAAVAKRLADFSKHQRHEIFTRLIAEGLAFEHPRLPGSRTVRFGVQRPDPRDYLRAAVSRLKKQIEKTGGQLAAFGISIAQTFAAAFELLDGRLTGGPGQSASPAPPLPCSPTPSLPVSPGFPLPLSPSPPLPCSPPADFASAFDAAFGRLDRSSGSHNFVSLADLRPALAAWSREEFDRELRELRIAGRFELAGAESVNGLGPEDRAAGIQEAGSLLLYVSRRRP